jgi:hypothetical protein
MAYRSIAHVLKEASMCLKRRACVTHTLVTQTLQQTLTHTPQTHHFKGLCWIWSGFSSFSGSSSSVAICSGSSFLSACEAHELKGPPPDSWRDRGPCQRDGPARGLLGRACCTAPPRRPSLPAPSHPRAAADATAWVCGRYRALPPPTPSCLPTVYTDSLYISNI